MKDISLESKAIRARRAFAPLGTKPWPAMLLVALLVVAPACDVILLGVTGPPTAVAGKTFEIVVTGQQLTNQSGQAAAVVQLPPGFSLAEAWATTAQTSLTLNDPAVVGLYTPEPGHSVVSLSGTVTAPSPVPASAVFRICAPEYPVTATFKVSLAGEIGGTWVAQDPASGGSFAAHTDAGARVSVDVVCAGLSAAPPWAGQAHGLPAGGARAAGHDLEVGDVDGDGREDIVAVAVDPSQGTSRIVVRRSTGHGFEPLNAPFSAGWITGPTDVALADFDGDGHLDVADDTGRVYFGDGGTSWTESVYSTDRFVRIECGDIDRDGRADIVALYAVNVGFGSTGARVFLGGPTLTELSSGLPQLEGGNVAAIFEVPIGASPQRELLLSGTINSSDPGLQVWRDGIVSGTWFIADSLPLPASVGEVVATGDVDGDGDDDVILGGGIGPEFNGGTDQIDLVTTSPSGLSYAGTVSPVGAIGGTVDAVRLADVSGSPALDIVCGLTTLPGGTTPSIAILEGDGNGGFTLLPHASGLGPALHHDVWDLGVTDLDGQGGPDVVGSLDEAGFDAWCRVVTPTLGACAAGATRGGGSLLRVSGSDGGADRIVDVALGAAFTIDVLQPPAAPGPANFVIFGRFCMPAADEVVDLGALGALCFEPGLSTPSPAKFTLASTYPLANVAIPATPTPWSANVPGGLSIPLILTFQGIVIEELGPPNVVRTTNAVALRVQ